MTATKPVQREPKGFDCTACKKRHDFPAYVFAHWREVITHTCDCGAKHEIICGRVLPIGKEQSE